MGIDQPQKHQIVTIFQLPTYAHPILNRHKLERGINIKYLDTAVHGAVCMN